MQLPLQALVVRQAGRQQHAVHALISDAHAVRLDQALLHALLQRGLRLARLQQHLRSHHACNQTATPARPPPCLHPLQVADAQPDMPEAASGCHRAAAHVLGRPAAHLAQGSDRVLQQLLVPQVALHQWLEVLAVVPAQLARAVDRQAQELLRGRAILRRAAAAVCSRLLVLLLGPVLPEPGRATQRGFSTPVTPLWPVPQSPVRHVQPSS